MSSKKITAMWLNLTILHQITRIEALIVETFCVVAIKTIMVTIGIKEMFIAIAAKIGAPHTKTGAITRLTNPFAIKATSIALVSCNKICCIKSHNHTSFLLNALDWCSTT